MQFEIFQKKHYSPKIFQLFSPFPTSRQFSPLSKLNNYFGKMKSDNLSSSTFLIKSINNNETILDRETQFCLNIYQGQKETTLDKNELLLSGFLSAVRENSYGLLGKNNHCRKIPTEIGAENFLKTFFCLFSNNFRDNNSNY